MKSSICVILLLTLIPAALSGARSEARRTERSSVSNSWPQDSTVKVYFVKNQFSAEQKVTLWEALESWSRKSSGTGSELRFLNAGDIGGLIDCAGCLTITREPAYTYDSRRRSSFNQLRQDGTGQIMSAWIGLASEATQPGTLKELLLKALEREKG